MTTGNELVDKIGEIAITGNIIPHTTGSGSTLTSHKVKSIGALVWTCSFSLYHCLSIFFQTPFNCPENQNRRTEHHADAQPCIGK